jgi:hypothetical protein
MFTYKIVSKNLVCLEKVCYKGRKKSLAGRMRPAGLTLAMSVL